ncbi:16670_t:CDS:2, partial [Acaulospora colombiana]
MSHNNGNYNNSYTSSLCQVDNSPDDTPGHRRRDSNVSAMSIQLYDVVGSGHQRRDSNVSNMSMQLDTPTPSSGTESGNEEETNVSPLVAHQRMRRMSLDISMEAGYLNGSPEGRNEKPSPMHRAVRARRASLLEFLNNWVKIRDIQPSPPPHAASKLNPEIELTLRQDTPSPTSAVGPWPITSDDRFEPYFNPKRRAVSPSLVGSPPVASSVPSPPTNTSSSSYSLATIGTS